MSNTKILTYNEYIKIKDQALTILIDRMKSYDLDNLTSLARSEQFIDKEEMIKWEITKMLFGKELSIDSRFVISARLGTLEMK